MRLRKLIKTNARRALAENWTRAAAIALLALALSLLFLMIEGILTTALRIEPFIDPFNTPENFLDNLPNPSGMAVAVVSAVALLYFVLMPPFELGVALWFYRLGDARVEETSCVFEFFGSMGLFAKSVLLHLSILVRSVLWTMLFVLPAAALLIFAELSSNRTLNDFESFLSTGISVCAAALLILALFFSAVWCMRYYLVDFALADDMRRSVRESVRYSVRATRGRRLELLFFELSMLGWRLLDLLILPRMYTLPYRQTARGLYARYLFEVSRRGRTEVT